MNGQATITAGKVATVGRTKNKSKSTKASAKKKAVVVSNKILVKISAVLLVIVLIVLGAFGYTEAYKNKIYPKIRVAGIKIGGLTPEKAKILLAAKALELDKQGPEITYNDQTLKPVLSEMGVTFNVDQVISEAYNYGRSGSLQEKLLNNFKILSGQSDLNITPQIDEDKFNAYLGQLAEVAEKEPVNASLEIKNGIVVTIPSEKGRGLDKEALKNDLKDFINSGKNGQVVMVTSDLEPKINEENTNDAKMAAEKYMAAQPITVTFEDSSWTANQAEIGSWIKFNEDENQLVASIQPGGFINYIAGKVEIPAVDREIEDGTGNVLSEGSDGRGVDVNTLTAQIKNALAHSQSGTFSLIAYTIPRGQKTIYPHAQPGRYAGKYIDINLSEQTLYAFEGGALVNQFLISSGKWGYGTPTGEFAVYGKDTSALMDGPDYYLPNVPYISWFSGDYSIHGTYWHSNFGHPMSHGCVNAATSDAEWLFNWDDIGTPVFIHT